MTSCLIMSHLSTLRRALISQGLEKEHLRVSWSVWHWNLINTSFGPCGLFGGISLEGDCCPHIPSVPIKLLSVEFGDQIVFHFYL